MLDVLSRELRPPLLNTSEDVCPPTLLAAPPREFRPLLDVLVDITCPPMLFDAPPRVARPPLWLTAPPAAESERPPGGTKEPDSEFVRPPLALLLSLVALPP